MDDRFEVHFNGDSYDVIDMRTTRVVNTFTTKEAADEDARKRNKPATQ